MITRKIKRIFKKNLRYEITFEPRWDRYRVVFYWKDKQVDDFIIAGFIVDEVLGNNGGKNE